MFSSESRELSTYCKRCMICVLYSQNLQIQSETPQTFQTGGRAYGAPVLDPPLKQISNLNMFRDSKYEDCSKYYRRGCE